ncbi:hypothetical protein AAG906_019765 [Vitis piasezkii]
MDEAKPVSTPMSSIEILLLHDGSPACDATEYRQLSQYMHQPSTAHWVAMKRVLRYLKGTVDYGLFLRSHSSLALHVFADADYASNKDNYSSTSAYVIFLGPNLVKQITKNQLWVSHVHTADQLADSLTKPLARTLFQFHRSKLNILPNVLRLRGHDRT